jgi:integrase
MQKVLTDTLIRSIKAPDKGRIEIADLRCPGLEFRITGKGVATWSFRFRDPKSSKPTRYTIGVYPAVSLAKARIQADEKRKLVASGTNPVAAKRQARRDAGTKTFDALADRYLARHAEPHKRSADADKRNLRLHVRPKWGSRRYDEITRRDVIDLIDGIVDAGKPTLANRVHSLVSKIYSFALNDDLVSAHPCARLAKRGSERVGRRVLSDSEIRLFWSEIVKKPVSHRVGLALRKILLTGARTVEVARIDRAELYHTIDPKQAAWIVPGLRTKNKRDHFVPLSALARQTVAEAMKLATNGQFLFPSPYVDSKPITEHALTVAMERFADHLRGDSEAIKTWRADPPTPHDLRRTFSTRLASLGISKEDRDATMNHVRSDVGSKHYDLYDRAREKRQALELWSASLSAILSDSQLAQTNVVPFSGTGRRVAKLHPN